MKKKFYQLKQYNTSLGFFRNRSDAERYSELFNTKVDVYPVKIVEHEFMSQKQIKEELKGV